ncbi:hypothetical protein ACHAW6_006258 [Cyclotella cf. meneghiniana]
MMHPCTQNLNLSAHKALEGMFSFNVTPMTPIGTECMIHIKPSRHHTWGYHAIKAWYFSLRLGLSVLLTHSLFSTILYPLQLSAMQIASQKQ